MCCCLWRHLMAHNISKSIMILYTVHFKQWWCNSTPVITHSRPTEPLFCLCKGWRWRAVRPHQTVKAFLPNLISDHHKHWVKSQPPIYTHAESPTERTQVLSFSPTAPVKRFWETFQWNLVVSAWTTAQRRHRKVCKKSVCAFELCVEGENTATLECSMFSDMKISVTLTWRQQDTVQQQTLLRL